MERIEHKKRGARGGRGLRLVIVLVWSYLRLGLSFDVTTTHECPPATNAACYPFDLGTHATTTSTNLQACKTWCESNVPGDGHCCEFDSASSTCRMTAATATDTRHTHSTSTVSSMLCGPVSHYTASSDCNWVPPSFKLALSCNCLSPYARAQASFPRDSGCAANEGIFYPTTVPSSMPSSCTPANSGCSDNDFMTGASTSLSLAPLPLYSLLLSQQPSLKT